MRTKQAMNPRETRLKLGINQKEFWERLGVTQSGGSRFENGRQMSLPVQMLYQLTYLERLDLEQIKREDMDTINYLRSEHAADYKNWKKQASQWMKERAVR